MIADLQSGNGIESVPEDIDIAYFLVHAMSDRVDDLSEIESALALNFNKMLKKQTAAKSFI